MPSGSANSLPDRPSQGASGEHLILAVADAIASLGDRLLRVKITISFDPPKRHGGECDSVPAPSTAPERISTQPDADAKARANAAFESSIDFGR